MCCWSAVVAGAIAETLPPRSTSFQALAEWSLNDLRKKMEAEKPLSRGPITHSNHNPLGQPLEEVSCRLFRGQL